MAGVKFDINVTGLKELQKDLNTFKNRVENSQEFYKLVGEKWVSQIQQSFVNSKDSYGKSWSNVARNGRPLLDTGRLVSSINYNINRDSLIVGSPVIYSRTHNEGLNNVIKRQFIPSVDDSNFKRSNLIKSLDDIIKEYYLGVFDE